MKTVAVFSSSADNPTPRLQQLMPSDKKFSRPTPG